jgi:RNA polymerase sigma factor for flagellar operon FliA
LAKEIGMATLCVPDTHPARTARDELIETHVPLVGHLVRRALYRLPAHINADDLTSAAMTALVLAARSFDADRGVPFHRYATLRINGAITDELRSLDWASRSARTASRQLESVRDQLHGALGRTPTTAELASALGISVDEVHDIEGEIHRAHTLSLDGFAPGENIDPAAPNKVEPEMLLLFRERMGYLHDAIAELPERHRFVITSYFFEQRQQNDIAEELGVTGSRVSQIQAEALRMLLGALQAHQGPQAEALEIVPGRRSKAAAYLRAVAERSTLAERLARTSPTGEIMATPELAGSALAS